MNEVYDQLVNENEDLKRKNDELHVKLATTKTCLENTRNLVEARDKQLYFRDQTIKDLKEKIDRYKEVILWLIDMLDLPEEY